MMNDMGSLFRTVAVAFGILCLVGTSCTKEEINPYLDSIWKGQYPVQTLNGTTGEMEDHIGTITLEFVDGGRSCRIFTGIAGMIGMNMHKYDARWTGKGQVSLYDKSGEQSIVVYSGVISDSGTEMVLQALNCDSVAATYKLLRDKNCWAYN